MECIGQLARCPRPRGWNRRPPEGRQDRLPGCADRPELAAGTAPPRCGHRGRPVSYTHLTLPTICSV
eukprot:89081-Alexandrium_andersonii.AAC.1